MMMMMMMMMINYKIYTIISFNEDISFLSCSIYLKKKKLSDCQRHNHTRHKKTFSFIVELTFAKLGEKTLRFTRFVIIHHNRI